MTANNLPINLHLSFFTEIQVAILNLSSNTALYLADLLN
jgi:hypothetical protein